MQPEITPDKADELVLKCLEGELTEQEQADLERWLLQSPEHVLQLANLGFVEESLFSISRQESAGALLALLADQENEFVIEHPVDITEQVKRDRLERRRARGRQRVGDQRVASHEVVIPKAALWLAAAAVIGLALWLGLYTGKGSQPTPDGGLVIDTPPNEPALPSTATVALVTSEYFAQWDEGHAPSPTRVLEADHEVFLEQGMARVVLPSGVEVTLEAPARFMVTGGNAAELTAGRLTADVPALATGFTVQTPGGLVTDYGTEFGVAVDESGAIDTHVFTGEVTFQSTAGHLALLKQGDGVRYTRADGMQQTKADPQAFVRKDQFDELVDQQQEAYKRWLAYSRELRSDPETVLYFSFTADDEQANRLRNVAEETADGLHGKLAHGASSPTWDNGRFPQKRGLRFDRAKTQFVAVPHDDRLNPRKAITIACWINRAGEGGQGGIFLTKADSNERISYQFGGFSGDSPIAPSAVQFVANQVVLGARESFPVLHKTQSWEHIAVTYDGTTVNFYHNGVPAGTETLSGPWPGTDSPLLIGRQGQYERSIPNPFGGVMDEMVVLSRAMDKSEIKRMYQQGAPVIPN